ncbi:MAG: 3'-5' exonuclease [Bacteroides sp.]|nr:3'-5' exonuclease [Bacteroides sp.]MBD5378030.1 3'-5' exonuclease [Bacteroides sp.]
MNSFVAIDVETANNHPTSICSIGAVKVVDGLITDTFYELVKPEPDYYFRHFTENIHGIGRADTEDARCFAEVWADVDSFLEGLPLVAHNKAFDEKCIRAAHRCYGMDYPDYEFHCTLVTARRTIPRQLCPSFSLPNLCSFLGIPFDNHHNALADAEACAKIALTICK